MYESFYGLTGKPFQLTPDPAFFFRSRGHSRAMAYLQYGVHKAEGFIVITGEVGAGKSTLVRNLLRQLPVDGLVAVQLVSTQLDADDMLRMVAGAFFGVTPEIPDKAALILALERYFQQLYEKGKRALLIVDEAQNLTPRAVEELRMLSNFQIKDKSLMQSLLLGQPEFREIMQRPEMRQLRQRVTASAHLGPLDREETQAYIEHRLKLVGWSASPRFETEAYQKIHEYSEGIPRQINVLCDRLLLAGFLAEKKVIGPADVNEVFEEFKKELGELAGHRPGSSPALNPAYATSAANSANGLAMNGSSASDARRLAAGIPLPKGSERVLLSGLTEQVRLMEQSVASMSRVLTELMALNRPPVETTTRRES